MNDVEYIEGGHGSFYDDRYNSYTATVTVTFTFDITVDAQNEAQAEEKIDREINDLYDLEWGGHLCDDIEVVECS